MTNPEAFALGAIVTLLCAGIPFWLSSRQLAREAARLHKLSSIIITALETAGLAKVSRDKKCDPTGVIVSISGTSHLRFSTSGSISAREDPPQPSSAP